ncbi:hypothetical protein CDAR_431671 [Caerostris darwini]|uniref:Uncharacterized protein n=1 Tax=Caerostris darwini TaxID=1538125 RepID=A0AAV4SUD5_9ARAC|nr:hypothetical protein CDAR_431671 [Caerostris darwini]
MTSFWGGSDECVADCLGAIYHLVNGNGSEKSASRRSLRNEQQFYFTKRPTITILWLGYPNGNGSVSSLCSFAEPATHDLPEQVGEIDLLQFPARRLWTHSSRAFSEERHMDRILRTGSAVKRNNPRRLRLQLEATSSWGGSGKCVVDCLGTIYHLMNGKRLGKEW